MCIAKQPKPQPVRQIAPPAPPPPPPPPPTRDEVVSNDTGTNANNPSASQARRQQRRTAARATGRSDTILGGALASNPANSTLKTLLGS